ncbi:nucleotidyltransferase [Staphylococcus pseudintermedius]|uniref:Putative class I CCA-adding enzyme n=9 Tax=Staphylococcus pseudintermedius TaxID=283734 RepID=T2I4H0_STAPS|nr:nucleotidyltransferase [Staphylococcus pseudintermedius]EGQ1588368.1 nucleotidyltransferase [Staphylococcus pseudintermedius]EGQ1626044.1 nucleotidyltransferase [Staphylococcus pseudintermedius]EGQ1660172.1 nucleotidyltransferase [Staphylococcus pseudintermedius]EGQ1661226.1 nucleotidyltransferase [Staphylococcus pseudintermedius]EGQ1674210.1 nucleotidyltransferase [Staphylococcus pseudintermedius]
MNKSDIIEKVLKNIDISPTMERNAHEKYDNISSYLSNKGLVCNFYPQGSFLLGTVIRPYKDGKDKLYDLDVISIIDKEKSKTTPYKSKYDIGNLLKESEIYSEKLKEEDIHCWTLEYANVGDVGFTLDIVPSVVNNYSIYNHYNEASIEQKSISITERISVGNYGWKNSNPIGFGDWFKQISDRHISELQLAKQKEKLQYELRDFYASVEEIPQYLYRTSLQRAVQFLKRVRDIYFERTKNQSFKPSTFLLTSLVASSVEHKFNLSIEEIIQAFINGFMNKTIPIMRGGDILNPIDNSEILNINWTRKNYEDMVNWLSYMNKYLLNDGIREFEQEIRNELQIPSIHSETKYNNVSEIKPWKGE